MGDCRMNFFILNRLLPAGTVQKHSKLIMRFLSQRFAQNYRLKSLDFLDLSQGAKRSELGAAA